MHRKVPEMRTQELSCPMVHRWIKRILAFLMGMALVVLLLNRCTAFWTAPVSGSVVDGVNGDPIAGAHVVAKWFVSVPWFSHAGSDDYWQRTEEAVTDRNGLFRFPLRLSKPIVGFPLAIQRKVHVTVSKQGMVAEPGALPYPILSQLISSRRYRDEYRLVVGNLMNLRPYFSVTSPTPVGERSNLHGFSQYLDVDGNLIRYGWFGDRRDEHFRCAEIPKSSGSQWGRPDIVLDRDIHIELERVVGRIRKAKASFADDSCFHPQSRRYFLDAYVQAKRIYTAAVDDLAKKAKLRPDRVDCAAVIEWLAERRGRISGAITQLESTISEEGDRLVGPVGVHSAGAVEALLVETHGAALTCMVPGP